mgnify:FL=1
MAKEDKIIDSKKVKETEASKIQSVSNNDSKESNTEAKKSKVSINLIEDLSY